MTRLFHALSVRRVWLVLLPITLIFASPCVIRLLNTYFSAAGGNNLPPLPGALLAIITVPFVLFMFMDLYLLSQVEALLLVGLLALGICLFIVLRKRGGRGARVLAGLTAVAIVALPVVFYRTPYFEYLEARGYAVYAIPSQQNFLDAAVDGVVSQFDGKACQYDLLGWTAENVLYYDRDCRFTGTTTWQYDPTVNQARLVPMVAEPLVTEAETLLVHPAYAPIDHRSPDGRWVASVWEKHAYEPENVIVVHQPNSDQ